MTCVRIFSRDRQAGSALLVFAAIACSLGGTKTSVAAEKLDKLPNVVILLVDDMGYGDPGCYNHQSQIATPNIDSLAREGMLFTDAHAAGPLCHVSRYGLITGRYPFRADVGRWPRHAVIEPKQTTIASLMKSRGYHTAMVGKWHLGFEEADYDAPWPGGPVDVGFNSYLGIRASTDIPPYFYIRNNRAVVPPTTPLAEHHTQGWSPIQGAFWRKGKIAADMKLSDVLPNLTTEAISIVDQHATANAERNEEVPLMLYLALPAPHTPWLPSEEFRNRSKVELYGDFVEMVDAMIGKVLSALAKAAMSDNTLLILSSDNGPVWYETDVKRFGHDSAGGLRGMKGDAWEAGHRMPFIVRWPGKVAAGSRCDRLICFTDVLATLATIVGYDLQPGEGPDSCDFSGQLLGNEGPRRNTLVMKSSAGFMTVRENNWKLIQGLGSGGFSQPAKISPVAGQPTGQLYDLSTDLGETENLYDRHPEIVKRLEQILAREIQNDDE